MKLWGLLCRKSVSVFKKRKEMLKELVYKRGCGDVKFSLTPSDCLNGDILKIEELSYKAFLIFSCKLKERLLGAAC